MRQIFSSAYLQAPFLRAGYIQVPMLEQDEVVYILSELSGLRPDDGFAPQGPDEFARYHCSFLDSNIDYKRRTHELIKRIFAPHIESYLNGYIILNCNFYVKPPGTGEFAIHQNWPAIADLNDTTVTVWCPLVDVVAQNGALQLVEGSHKILPHVEGPNSPCYFTHFRRELIEKYLKPHPMNAGEALIFDDSLIHWSANNDSEHARVAIQILCVPADAQPVYFFFDSQHPERFEVIEVDSEFFVASHVSDLQARQPGWKSAGFVANKNRLITENEFAGLLARGEHIREDVYSQRLRLPNA
jgi:hypothetical protein